MSDSPAPVVATAEGAPEAVTIPLRYPIKYAGQRITEIVVQPMSGVHQRRSTIHPDQNSQGFLAELAILLSGQPQQVIDALVGNDLGAVNLACKVFFIATQETGNDE